MKYSFTVINSWVLERARGTANVYQFSILRSLHVYVKYTSSRLLSTVHLLRTYFHNETWTAIEGAQTADDRRCLERRIVQSRSRRESNRNINTSSQVYLPRSINVDYDPALFKFVTRAKKSDLWWLSEPISNGTDRRSQPFSWPNLSPNQPCHTLTMKGDRRVRPKIKDRREKISSPSSS